MPSSTRDNRGVVSRSKRFNGAARSLPTSGSLATAPFSGVSHGSRRPSRPLYGSRSGRCASVRRTIGSRSLPSAIAEARTSSSVTSARRPSRKPRYRPSRRSFPWQSGSSARATSGVRVELRGARRASPRRSLVIRWPCCGRQCRSPVCTPVVRGGGFFEDVDQGRHGARTRPPAGQAAAICGWSLVGGFSCRPRRGATRLAWPGRVRARLRRRGPGVARRAGA
jgi:hypothetical protein